jgi:hypothetical protein
MKTQNGGPASGQGANIKRPAPARAFLGVVSIGAGCARGLERNVELIDESGGFIFQLRVSMKLVGKAGDEARSKAPARRLLDLRPALLDPSQLESRVFLIDHRGNLDAIFGVG